MWECLNQSDKEKYKNLILNFASLTKAFTQKNDENSTDNSITPVINSKFQETVFQKAFGAIGEDIANTSFDASLIKDESSKYLIGIKSFGLKSGDQKVAQFKKNSVSDKWDEILTQIKKNADEATTKDEADSLNEELYLKLAKRISELRNMRIKSSREQIKGFKYENDVDVKSVYHVLMPSIENNHPIINVGEIDYSLIDIENLKVLGSTKKENPKNFTFEDGNHKYKFTSADSQLLMNFDNKNIIVESWDVNYIDDPIEFFSSINELVDNSKNNKSDEVDMTVSWMISQEDGTVSESSGFNGFDGAPKIGSNKEKIDKKIKKIIVTYEKLVDSNELQYITNELREILINSWKKDTDKFKKRRDELVNYAAETNEALKEDISKILYRPVSEMYIPLASAKKFHEKYPDFFGKNIGKFKEDGKKLLLPKDEREFTLEFLASGNRIRAYINQEAGKSIQSTENQSILGEWILRKVFQLKERERLTSEKLDELHINAIRLTKFKDKSRGIGIEFIWIDRDNPPNDVIGWVQKYLKD